MIQVLLVSRFPTVFDYCIVFRYVSDFEIKIMLQKEVVLHGGGAWYLTGEFPDYILNHIFYDPIKW